MQRWQRNMSVICKACKVQDVQHRFCMQKCRPARPQARTTRQPTLPAVSLTRPPALPVRSITFTSLGSASPATSLLLLFKHNQLMSSCYMLQATNTAAQQGRKAADAASATADKAAEDMSQVGPDAPKVVAVFQHRTSGVCRPCTCCKVQHTAFTAWPATRTSAWLCPSPTAAGCRLWAVRPALQQTWPKPRSRRRPASAARHTMPQRRCSPALCCQALPLSSTSCPRSGDCAPPAMDGAAKRPGYSW